MTRPSSSGTGKPTTSSQPSAMSSSPKKKCSRPPPKPAKSPRTSLNRLRVQDQQRRTYIHHLSQWSLDYDSSPHFQGKISLFPHNSWKREDLELGKSVTCVLTDASFTDARQKIVIRLFPPQRSTKNFDNSKDVDERRDSMDVFGSEGTRQPTKRDTKSKGKHNQVCAEGAKGHYKLVVRYGAGWMSAREYFSKVYFSHLEAQRASHGRRLSLDDSLAHRSQALGPPLLDKESVTIRPLFRPFSKLPSELQEMILSTAAGLSRTYNLCSDEYGTLKTIKNQSRSAISLSTLFRISKDRNEHLIPYIFHSTDFQFGLTGFTNFLWQSGPTNRREIRRLSFHFGKLALLHCIRWLAPNAIFSLFEPPVATNPRSLQYFWRCQIQDLVKELNLFTLTINIAQIPTTDLPMVVAILKNAFGSVERIYLVRTGKDGVISPVAPGDEVLSGLKLESCWKEMCLGYYQEHRQHSYCFKFELLKGEEKDLEDEMDKDKGFFDIRFSPLCSKEKLLVWK